MRAKHSKKNREDWWHEEGIPYIFLIVIANGTYIAKLIEEMIKDYSIGFLIFWLSLYPVSVLLSWIAIRSELRRRGNTIIEHNGNPMLIIWVACFNLIVAAFFFWHRIQEAFVFVRDKMRNHKVGSGQKNDTINKCEEDMKVKELIQRLQELDQDIEVLCYSEDDDVLPQNHGFRIFEIIGIDERKAEKIKGKDGIPSLMFSSPNIKPIAFIDIAADV